MEDVAIKNGYTVLLCNSDRNVIKERTYLDFLIEKRIDGVVIVKPQISAEEIKVISGYTQLVLVDAPQIVDLPCDYIDVDDFGGSLSAVHKLCELGHKRIAFIEGIASKSGSSRSEAYFKGLHDYGIEIDFTLIRRGAYDWHSGYAWRLTTLWRLGL
jgi:LacI family transcriptional regulator